MKNALPGLADRARRQLVDLIEIHDLSSQLRPDGRAGRSAERSPVLFSIFIRGTPLLIATAVTEPVSITRR